MECMISRYYYFKSVGLKYQPYVCIGCHEFSMSVMNLSDFFIWNIKGVDYRVYASGVSNQEAINILKNSDLSDKGVI